MTNTNTPAVTLTTDHAEMLVLSILVEGPAYGYSVAKAINARSDGSFKLGPSQLYPLLKRLERQHLVTTDWEEVKADNSDPEASGRRRKWYRLSAKGTKRLHSRIEAHRRFNKLLDSFIAPLSQGSEQTA